MPTATFSAEVSRTWTTVLIVSRVPCQPCRRVITPITATKLMSELAVTAAKSTPQVDGRTEVSCGEAASTRPATETPAAARATLNQTFGGA